MFQSCLGGFNDLKSIDSSESEMMVGEGVVSNSTANIVLAGKIGINSGEEDFANLSKGQIGVDGEKQTSCTSSMGAAH